MILALPWIFGISLGLLAIGAWGTRRYESAGGWKLPLAGLSCACGLSLLAVALIVAGAQ